jgi:hypothetical protein
MLEKRNADWRSVRFQFFCLIAEKARQIDESKNRQNPVARKDLATRNDPMIPEKTPTNSMALIRSIFISHFLFSMG